MNDVEDSVDDEEGKEESSDVPISWIIEEAQLEEYFLLVRRIQGIGLSIDQYWAMDTWTTAKLLNMERMIMEEEQKAYSDKDEYVERPDGNSEEMNALMDEMMNE